MDLRLVIEGGPAVEGTVRATQEHFDRAAEAGAITAARGAPLPFRIAAAPDVAPQVASSAVGLPALVHE